MTPKRKSPNERIRLAKTDPRVKAWYESQRDASPSSSRIYVTNLSRVLEENHLSVEQFVALARDEPGTLESLLAKWQRTRMDKRGTKAASIRQFYAALRSFLHHEHVLFDDYPKLKVIKGSTLSNERVPTQTELGLICAALTPRWRTAELFIAHSGIRPGVLCANAARKDGAPALQLRHLPDLILKPEPHFAKVPFVIQVPKELSKTGKSYVTFGGQELADALLAYLKTRSNLTPDSFVLTGKLSRRDPTSEEVVEFEKEPVQSFTLNEALTLGIKKVVPDGVRWRPYVARAYFSTQLHLAEGRGLISRELRECFMGHDVGTGGTYNVGKAWSEDMLEQARATYAKCLPLLETAQRTTSQEVVELRQLNRVFIEGNPVLRLLSTKQKEELEALTPMELIRQVTRRMKPADETPKQKVFPNENVPAMLAKGWTVAAPLGSDQMVLNAPGATD